MGQQLSLFGDAKKHISLDGDEELFKLFHELPINLASQVVKAAGVPGARLIIDEARRNTPEGPTGNLKRSIGVIRPRGAKPYILVGARVKKKGRYQSGFHAGWIAYGTVKMTGIGEWIAEAAGRVQNNVMRVIERESGKIIDQRIRKHINSI